MGVLWGGLLAVAWWAETHPNGPAALAAGAALEGKEVRFGDPGVGAVRGVHHRHLDRRGQLAARPLHRPGRRGHAAEHAARRGRAGRGRGRAVRHPGARRDRGVPGRADGRAHPGVPGQEARPHARSPPRRSRSWRCPRSCCSAPAPRWPSRASSTRRWPTPARTGCPRCSTPTPRRATTTAARSPG